MGCWESREERKTGQITCLSKVDYEKYKDELKYIALDCSLDLLYKNVKGSAKEAYLKQRLEGAHFLDLNEFSDSTKKPIEHKIPTDK